MDRFCLSLCLAICILLTSCLPNQMLTRSGALNTISINLDDENVTYEQLSNTFDVSSFGGFLDTQPDKTFQSKSSTVINNNGRRTRTMVVRNANFLKFITLFSSSLTIRALALEAFPNAEDSRNAVLLPSLLLSLPLNEGIWRPFNRNQVRGITTNRLIGRSPDAHFYSFPNSNIAETTKLFGTSWEGENYIVAGTISNELVQGAGPVSSPMRSAEDFYNQRQVSEASPFANKGEKSVQTSQSKSRHPVFVRFGVDMSKLVSTGGQFMSSWTAQNLEELDYTRKGGIRFGIGTILRSREGLEFQPELCLSTRTISLNSVPSNTRIRLLYGNLSGTARFDVVRDLVFVEGRLGALFAMNGKFRSDEDGWEGELDIRNPWRYGDRMFQLGASGFDVTLGLGVGLRIPGIEQLAIAVGVDLGLLAHFRQVRVQDYSIFGESSFDTGSTDRFNTVSVSATYSIVK